MGIATLILIAFSLSFDSFAVSVCSGLSLCRKHLKLTDALKIALSLAVFQGAMPLLGWFIGETFSELIMQADHWIAFFLLSALGAKMIYEGRIPANKKKIKNPTHWKVILTMSFATSIDALAIGVGFSFFVEQMLFPSLLIGFVTFMVSMSGIYMGKKLGTKLAGIAEIGGGIILILIGVKIVLEHLFLI
ncbi:MAG: manganese efflux pump MntP family protein [Prolixibacteraceae bacterium]